VRALAVASDQGLKEMSVRTGEEKPEQEGGDHHNQNRTRFLAKNIGKI